eukprot:2516805-Lingulodinium_polyedra.AAC.1
MSERWTSRVLSATERYKDARGAKLWISTPHQLRARPPSTGARAALYLCKAHTADTIHTISPILRAPPLAACLHNGAPHSSR